MAASLMRLSFCCVVSVLITVNNETLASSLDSSKPEDSLWVSLKGTSRYKRQTCEDGDYLYERITCCQCPAGQRVTQHCTDTSETKCELCEKGTYNNPSSLETCQPCTSCAHPSANLEEEEPCTPGRDAKCRCKKGYFCNSDTGNCRLCHKCKTCGSARVKQPCNGTSDTVCDVENNGGDKTAGAIIGAVFGVLVIVVLIVFAVMILKRRNRGTPNRNHQPQQSGSAVEMEDLTVPEVDLEPLMPDIAEQLGWTLMKDIAIRSNIGKQTIEDCERNNPGRCQDQTRELLQIWIERAGKGGSVSLISILRKMQHHTTADKVLAIFKSDA